MKRRNYGWYVPNRIDNLTADQPNFISKLQSKMIIGADIDEELQFSHSTLSALRQIEGRLLLLPPLFRTLIQDIDMLSAFDDGLQRGGSSLDNNHRPTQEMLQNYAAMASAYSQNAMFLRDKIRGTAELLSDTLNLKNQMFAQSMSVNTLELTNAAAADSAAIRTITVVTLLYLPATFVAVSSQCQHNHELESLTLADAVRNAVLWNRLDRWIKGGVKAALGLLSACNSLYGGHLRVLEMDG